MNSLLYICLTIILLSITSIVLSGAFFVAQLVWDRFWLVSFKILMQVYARFRFPDEFKENDVP